MSTPLFIDVKQVAALLSVSVRTVRRRWYDGTLPPPIKMGRAIRWRLLDIENYQGNYNGEHFQAQGPGRQAG